RSKLEDSSDDWMTASRLAERYIEIARSQSDPRYMGYAQAILEPWWDQPDSAPIKAFLLRAIIRQYEHDFDGATSDLKKVLTVQPRNEQAWLIKATIETIRGDYREALQSCNNLLRKSSMIRAIACQSVPASLSGKAKLSYSLLKKMVAVLPTVNPRETIWMLTSLGEMAWRMGLFEAADRHFQTALNSGIKDIYLLRIYGDFLLQQNRPSEVISLLSSETRIDSLLLRLTLAEKVLRSESLDKHIVLLQSRFDANRQRRSAMHKGDEARFTLDLLDDSERALALAKHNWLLQRESADTYILLRTALASNSALTVKMTLEWLAGKGTKDVLIDKIINQQTGRQDHV
ncbi:MAG: hypothetical protein V3V31_03480, partial [Methylococcales bacterium]